MTMDYDPIPSAQVESFKNLHFEDYEFLLASAKEALAQEREERDRGNVEAARVFREKALSLEMAADLVIAMAIAQPVDIV